MSTKIYTSLNPPYLSDSPCSSNSPKEDFATLHEGKRFLNLLKTFENLAKNVDGSIEGNVTDKEFLSVQSEILDILSTMENMFNRQGLFQYDLERASEMQNKLNDYSSPNDGGGGRGGSSKKRKRGGGSGGSIASILGIDAGNSNASTGKEAYDLSNLCRILMPTSTSSSNKERDLVQKYPPIIIAAASNTLTAICEHCVNHLPSLTATTEHSMIIPISSQVLSGIAKTIQLMLKNIDDSKTKLSIRDFSQYNEALASSCNCATILISLSGLRLSRSLKIMENIINAANGIIWRDYTPEDFSLASAREAAATLLSVIPLAGNASGDSPSELWIRNLLSSCRELQTSLVSFFPISKRLITKQKKNSGQSKDKVEWIKNVKSTTTSQAHRIQIFSMRLEGYIEIITSFLKMDRQFETSICFSLPIKSLLDIIETMFSFCTNAESKYLNTKPRLRNVSVEGGLLSPNAAITIANYVKFQANNLFRTVCSLLSNSALIHGSRMIAIVLSNLQSSSSYTLRSIIDPLSVADKNSKRKWLHSSIGLRTMSVESISYVIQRLGSNAVVSQPDNIMKLVTFITGTLLEQISDESGEIQKDVEREHWGTLEERSKLVETCIDTLAICISVSGGYLPQNSREIIESVANTCLDKCCEFHGSIYINSASTKDSILKLGINCITSPWSDGSASAMVCTVRKAASSLKFDRNNSVASTAYMALAVCNCLAVQRSPPLVIVSRDKNVDAFQEPDLMANFSRNQIEVGILHAKEKIITKKAKQSIGQDENNKIIKNSNQVQKTEASVQKKKLKSEHDNKKDFIKESNIKSSLHQTKTSRVKDQVVDEKFNGNVENLLTKDDELIEIENKHDGDDDTEKRDELLAKKQFDVQKVNEIQVPVLEDSNTMIMNQNNDDDDDSIGDDFPMIVDCDPDDEDID